VGSRWGGSLIYKQWTDQYCGAQSAHTTMARPIARSPRKAQRNGFCSMVHALRLRTSFLAFLTGAVAMLRATRRSPSLAPTSCTASMNFWRRLAIRASALPPFLQAIEPILHSLHDRIGSRPVAGVLRQRFGMQLILLQAHPQPLDQLVDVARPQVPLVHGAPRMHPLCRPSAQTLTATA
jgi:hypothetical protein